MPGPELEHETLGPSSRLEKGVLLAVLGWLAAFVGYKLPHLFDENWIEWDARAMALAAFRFHGKALFPRDLGADLAAAMCPPGWKLVYWVGTLFTNPYQISRLLPLAIFAFLLWQAFCFARTRGGIVVAAVTVFLIARCPFFWDRIIGANPRAFGLPLVVAFLRYATERRPRAVALVLIAQAAFYPSVLLLCAPAFAVVQLVEAVKSRRWQPLALLAICGLACAILVAPTALFVDARIGAPITLEELAKLRQRGMWSLYPLPPHRWVFERAIHIALEDEVGPTLLVERWDLIMGGVVIGLAAVVFAIGLVRRRVPLVFVALAGTSVGAYALASAVAYRLYVPDRMVHYAAPPIILLLFIPLTLEALMLLPEKRRPPRPRLVAAVLVATITLLAGGPGLSTYSGLHDWSAGRSPAVEFIATQQPDVLVAAHPATSSFVEVFARRSALFSGITNAPNFAQYGLTVEQRIAAFYDAYYASNIEDVRAFVQQHRVDYLLVDLRDYGTEGMKRARYVSPWTEYAQRKILAAHGTFALAHAPPEAFVFRDGLYVVLDAKKL